MEETIDITVNEKELVVIINGVINEGDRKLIEKLKGKLRGLRYIYPHESIKKDTLSEKI